MSGPDKSKLRSYQRFLDSYNRAIARADFQSAFRWADQALIWARDVHEPELEERALCNRMAAADLVGRAKDVATTCRELINRSPDLITRHLSAGILGGYYARRHDTKKAIFYGRMAVAFAVEAKREEFLPGGWCNLAGSFLGQYELNEAFRHYRKALRLFPRGSWYQQGIAYCGLGYCTFLAGDRVRSLRLLGRSIRCFARNGITRYQLDPHLALSHLYLELDRHDLAFREASAAHRIALTYDDDDGLKEALFFLGSAAIGLGELDVAERCFGGLQRRFVPDNPQLVELLEMTDSHRLVNLYA